MTGEAKPSQLVIDAYAFLGRVGKMLEEKDRSYGSSVSDPIRVFSKLDSEAAVRTRIDDKLSRIARGSDLGEDTLMDLAGYIALLAAMRDGGKGRAS